MMQRFLLFGLSLAVFLTACSESSRPPDVSLATGTWRSVLTVPGGELPFLLEIGRADGVYTAHVLNGDERVTVPEVYVEGDQLRLEFSTFNNRIVATLTDSTLTGNLTLVKRWGQEQVLPFQATLGSPYRFSPETPDTLDVSGRWAVTFTDDDGTISPAIGEFRTTAGGVQGTFLTPTGDHRYLAGEVRDSTLYLSCFDGAHVYLFTAAIEPDMTLNGDFWSGNASHKAWLAVRDEQAALPDPDTLTYLKPEYERFTFSFPNLDSAMVSLDDSTFKHQVVVVTLAGSWCPNCHDEAAFMSDFYKQHKERGLKVVALMYEHFGDFARAARQVERFKQQFGIEYDLLIAGISQKDEAAQTLPMLNHVLAFPTTLFVDRNGKVRRIHTGFSGPGTGEHYERLTEDFTRFVNQLLSERPSV